MAKDVRDATEQIMADRKVAYQRWLHAKNWLTYRGVEVNLCGGENQGDIVHDGVVCVEIEDCFRVVDDQCGDDETMKEAVEREWKAWKRTGTRGI